jgi:hypothetical protein
MQIPLRSRQVLLAQVGGQQGQFGVEILAVALPPQ